MASLRASRCELDASLQADSRAQPDGQGNESRSDPRELMHREEICTMLRYDTMRKTSYASSGRPMSCSVRGVPG